MNNSNHKSYNGEIFAPLRNEEAGVSLAQLRQYVAASSVARSLGWRLPTLLLYGIFILSVGLYLAIGTDRTSSPSPDVNTVLSSNNVPTAKAEMPVEEVRHLRASSKENSEVPDHSISKFSSATLVNRSEKLNMKTVSPDRNVPENAATQVQLSSKGSESRVEAPPPVVSAHSNKGDRESNHQIASAKDSTAKRISKDLSFDGTDDALMSIRKNASDSRYRVFGAIQAGIITSSLNTSGGGIALTFEHDWQHISFSYSSTFGTKGNSSELFRTIRPTEAYSQNVKEYSLQLGATIKQDDFWASFSAGPNYTNSFSYLDYYEAQLGKTISTGSKWQGLGATVQAVAGYKFSKYFGSEITLFATDHSQVAYGGILFSVVFGLL